MKFWFVHSREVPLIDQIRTQVRMAVLSGDLREGERLPSVRALARRYGLHHNTVSQAYQRLEEQGIVESRRGSGVYVRAAEDTATDEPRQKIAAMFSSAIALARTAGISEEALRTQLHDAMAGRQLERILLLDPDEEFRAIAFRELEDGLPGVRIEAQQALSSSKLDHTLVVARPSQAEVVRKTIPAGVPSCVLRIGSASSVLLANLPGPRGDLLGLASRWPTFLEIGRTMLLATGLDPEALILRDARDEGWQEGLEQASAVVCDSVTARELSRSLRALPFRLIADDCIEELKKQLAGRAL